MYYAWALVELLAPLPVTLAMTEVDVQVGHVVVIVEVIGQLHSCSYHFHMKHNSCLYKYTHSQPI